MLSVAFWNYGKLWITLILYDFILYNAITTFINLYFSMKNILEWFYFVILDIMCVCLKKMFKKYTVKAFIKINSIPGEE